MEAGFKYNDAMQDPQPAEKKLPGPRRWAPSLGLALLFATGVMAWTLTQPKLSFDDAYITYRYARNIAHGQGFVYNPGERVLGTTTPLYALVLAGLSLIWPDIPALSFIVGGLGWAGLVLLVYAIGRAAGSPAAGLIAALFVATDQLTNSTLGMETTLYVGLCLLAFCLLLVRRPRGAAFVAGLAFIMRWDGILVILVIGLAELIRQRRLPWQMALVWLAVAAPWLVFSQLYFGSIFPNTFFAKAGQANGGLTGGGAEAFATGLGQLVRGRLNANLLVWTYVLLGLVSLLNWRWLRTVWPVLAWTVLYFAGYTYLGVIGFHWYYVPLVPAVALAVGGGVGYLAQLLARGGRRWLGAAGALALAGLCLWPQVQFFMNNRPVNSPRVETYRQVSQWVIENTPANNSVALLEIGVIGYETNRRVVDMMGLVTPAMLGHLDNWNQAFYYAVARHWPNYVVALQGMAWTYPLAKNPLDSVYSVAATIKNPADSAAPILIYRRRPDFPPTVFADAWPQGLVFDQRFSLESIQAGAGALEPGQALPLRLTWKVMADVKDEYRFEIELINLNTGDRQMLLQNSQPMYGGAPTTQWRRGQQYAEDFLLPMPAALPPGAYRLRVHIYAGDQEVEPAPRAGSAALAMTGVLWTSQPMPLPQFTAAPVQLAEGIRLLGYRLEPASEAGQVALTLYWQGSQAVTNPYTVFVHIVDASGQMVGQHDAPPAGGALPVPLWGADVPVRDLHVAPIAAPLPPGALWGVGMYDPATLARLDILSGDGYTIHDNVACRPLLK